MWKRANRLRIKFPLLINHLVLIIKKYIINILRRVIKSQSTPIVFHVLPHVVVYIIHRFQMVGPESTQVLQQTTDLSHDLNSAEFNLPAQHTNVMSVLMDTISININRGVNIWAETRQIWTHTIPVL